MAFLWNACLKNMVYLFMLFGKLYIRNNRKGLCFTASYFIQIDLYCMVYRSSTMMAVK